MLNKDIKQPLLDDADNQVQVHQDYQYEGRKSEGKFYTTQMDTFKVIDIDNWKEIKDNSKDQDLQNIITKTNLESEKVKKEFDQKNDEKRAQLRANPIKILPAITTDPEMKAENQKEFIKEKQVKKSADPDEVIQMLRLKQLEDSFKKGFRHTVNYDDSITAQYSDLIVTSEAFDNQLVLVQTGINKEKRPVIYIRQVEMEGNVTKEQIEKSIKDNKSDEQKEAVGPQTHNHDGDHAKTILIQLQENVGEDTKPKTEWKQWEALPDPQAKLWIQIGDEIYFYVVKNDFEKQTTQFTLKKLNVANFGGEKGVEEVKGFKTDFLSLKTSIIKNVCGIQFVSWAVNMVGVSDAFKIILSDNMKSKSTIEEYVKGQLLCLQGQCDSISTREDTKNDENTKSIKKGDTVQVHCGMIVTAQDMGTVLFDFKQQNVFEQSKGPPVKDKDGNNTFEKGKQIYGQYEDTSMTFMLAVWKTSDLQSLTARQQQRGHWGAGIIYKMSRGGAHISKYVFWINKKNENSDNYEIDLDQENIMDEEKGMKHYKSYKKKADAQFQCYFHQILTLEKLYDGNVTFTVEKLSPDDQQFKVDLFQQKLKGYNENGQEYKDNLLSKEADTTHFCKRDQLMMVIQRDMKGKGSNDKVRAVVIEKNSTNELKTIMATHQNSTVKMDPFDFSKAKTWTKIQKNWSKGYKQIDPMFPNLFVDDGKDKKIRYIPILIEKKKDSKEEVRTDKLAERVDQSIQTITDKHENETSNTAAKTAEQKAADENKTPQEKAADELLGTCYHSTYTTLRRNKLGDEQCPFGAFNQNKKDHENKDDKKKFDKFNASNVKSEYMNINGVISARQMEFYNDDRKAYLRQVWGYDKSNKEIFIQVMKKNDKTEKDGLDQVLGETHCYTYFEEDSTQGSQNDGYLTERMKNTAFVPSSAVEKIEKNAKNEYSPQFPTNFEYQQKYELVIMDESGLFMDIFVYLFKWNDSAPDRSNHLLQLIGRKMLILSYNYQPQQGSRLMNYFPLIPADNYKIEGTHLFTNHNNATINWNIEIKPFTEDEYQFKGELCNTGYKLYEYDYHDLKKKTYTNRQCAFLIDTQLSDELREMNAEDIFFKREDKAFAELNFRYLPDYGKPNVWEPSLNNIQKNLIFEDQIRVTMNLWVPKPLASIIKKPENKNEIDFLAPLVVAKGLSFANFIINEPNAITSMMDSSGITKNRSIIQQFGNFMKLNSTTTGRFTDCFAELQEAFPKDKSWVRNEKEIMEDYLFQNPLFKCLNQPTTDDIKRTQVSCNFLIDKVMSSSNNQVNYNRMIQILPLIVQENAKGIPFLEYAPFFTDFDDDNEDPLTFCMKIEHQGLPKFSDLPYNFRKFEINEFPDTDLTDNLIDHLIAEFNKVKSREDIDELKKKLNLEIEEGKKTIQNEELILQNLKKTGSEAQIKGSGELVAENQLKQNERISSLKQLNKTKVVFDVPVQHFMINLSYLQTSQVLQAYFTRDKSSAGRKYRNYDNKEEILDESAFMTEQIFTQTLSDVNVKYGDSIDSQETMKDILDFIFFNGTRRYIILNFVIYVIFFICPYIAQMTMTVTKSELENHEKGIWESVEKWCLVISMVTQFGLFLIELLQMKQSGLKDYFADDYYNIFDTTSFIIYTTYFVMRIYNPSPMMVGHNNISGDLEIKVDKFLMVTIAFNFLILCSIVIKCFFYLRVNPQFGLQVELVLQACVDVKQFCIFMLIWITACALFTKILGSGNSMTASNEWGGFPGTTADFSIWMITWQDSIGNIQNPTYNFWSSVITNSTAADTDSANPNYFIDLDHDNLSASDVFQNIDSRTTSFQSGTALFMIYTIYVEWFFNQVFIFIILLNFLIAVISQSYEQVMDGKIQLQYRQRSILNNEYKIVMGSLGLLEKRCDCFMLTSNVEESDRGNEWSGFVQNMKKAIGKQATQINNNIKDLTTGISDYQDVVQNQIQHNEAQNIRDIKRLKDLINEITTKIFPSGDEKKGDDVEASQIPHDIAEQE